MGSAVAIGIVLQSVALVHVAVVVMRRAAPEDYDPSFRIPRVLYPAVPVLGFVACLAILTQMRPLVQGIGGLIILLGITWYVGYARDRPIREGLVGEALAPRPVANGQGRYRVVVPVANPATERRLLKLAAATASAQEGPAELIAVNVIEVPPQTSLEQDVTFEEERVERQQELLDAARDIAADLDVGLRTRAVVGRNVGEVVLDVITQESANQVLLGWKGARSRREYVLGSNIDPIVSRAPCETTIVKVRADEVGDVVALAGEGPHAPVAARRAHEFVTGGDGTSLTLLNVHRPADSDAEEAAAEAGDPEDRGRELVAEVAEEAGISEDGYELTVVVAADVETAILNHVDEYDTVCVGATRAGSVAQALFGSLPETVGERADATVAMVRGPDTSPMSVREAIVKRLSD